MCRASMNVSLALVMSIGCVGRPVGSEAGETSGTTESHDTDGSEEVGDGDGDGDGDTGDGDGDTGDGDGDGDGDTGDGDGEPLPLGPCAWVPAPDSECDVAFEPIPPESPDPIFQSQSIDQFSLIARADAVEIIWRRHYQQRGDSSTVRRYLASNAQGFWQHQFLVEWNCGPCSCGPQADPIIQGSANRTQLSPPYMRREAGQWQLAVVDPQDYEGLRAYYDAELFAVGPDDRSYLLGFGTGEQTFEQWLWAETDLGCHRVAWEFERDEVCRSSDIEAMAVDSEGFVHLIGSEEVDASNQLLVHWFVGPNGVERTELAPLAMVSNVSAEFALGDANELHVCHWATSTQYEYEMAYGHGHDANDWVSVGIEDPDLGDLNGPRHCRLALATDATAWLTWVSGSYDALDPFRVASVVDDVVTDEVVDVGIREIDTALAVDPMGRPWLAYRSQENDAQIIKLAHKDGDQWIIEEIATP